MIVNRRLGRLLSIGEAATRLGCSPAAMEELAATRQLLRLGNRYSDLLFGPPGDPALVPSLPAVVDALARGCGRCGGPGQPRNATSGPCSAAPRARTCG